jgi:integrase
MSRYDVRLFAVEERRGTERSTFRVRWQVAGKRFGETYQTRALAESFRSELMSAQRRGVAFDEVIGLPEPMARELNTRTWYRHACDYVDMIWPRSSPKHRKGIAETLAAVTAVLVTTDRGMPSPDVLRAALYGWSFNKSQRDAGAPPQELVRAITWVERHTVNLTALNDAALIRKVLDALALRLDGQPAAPSTVSRKRAVLSGVLRYAVELRHLDSHPFSFVKWSAPRTDEHVDRRVVVNPDQARLLIAAVASKTPELAAFFGCMYYAALRPEEALHLCEDDYERAASPSGWGWLHLSGATLTVGNDWTDHGTSVDRRGLKHRGSKATRDVPVTPELGKLLNDHMLGFPPGPGGRLFVTRRGPYGVFVPTLGQPIPNNSYTTAWRRARVTALTPAQERSPLAKRPYDLRHAAVSLWLNAGVPAPQVAARAGHSVNVLMRVYAKCLDGQEDAARHRIEAALRLSESAHDRLWGRIGDSD